MPKPKAKPAERQSKTEPQKRGPLFDVLLTFFRKPKRKTLTLELPRACKSYPYVAMKRAGVKAKAVYETVSKAANPLDDVLRFTIRLPKETHDKTPKQTTVAKSKAKEKATSAVRKPAHSEIQKLQPRKAKGVDNSDRLGRRKDRVREVVPITPTKGVDITQVAEVANA